MSQSKLSTQQTKPFIKVPNYILQYSFLYNKLILPIYIYSAILSNPLNNNTVDTNIAHIAETFLPNQDVRKQIPTKIENTIKFLMKDSPGMLVLIGKSKKPKNLPEFQKCFSFIPSQSIHDIKDKFSKTDRLLYKFENSDIKTHWTKIEIGEYYNIINQCAQKTLAQELGQQNQAVSQYSDDYVKWNSVELLNFFMYMRYRNNLYKSVSNDINDTFDCFGSNSDNNNGNNNGNNYNNSKIMDHVFEANSTIANNLNIGKNSVTKYKAQIKELGLTL